MQLRSVAIASILICLLAAGAVAQPDELPPLDAATRAAVVDSLTAVIDSVYVLAEPAAAIVNELRGNLAAGAYDGITDPHAFAERLYDDAQAVNHDGHFGVIALPPPTATALASPERVDPAEEERRRRLARAGNYGFKELRILPGGVGYLRFDRFDGSDEDAFAAASAAMNFLANSNAVILDVRRNGGGAAAMIRHICGYLFAERTHLINWEVRAEGVTTQSYSPDAVPGRRLLEQPVYVLTSPRTFSAAEEFTFDLRNLERATVVGDTTGGGGHTVAGYMFDFDGFRMGIRVPYGRAFDPRTGGGWEGTGVVPHIPVPAEIARETAHADALQRLIEAEEDEQVRRRYEWALRRVEHALNPVTLSADEMAELAGDYGPRHVLVAEGRLWYRRDGRDRHELTPLGDDHFAVGDLDYFMLEFGRDADGRVDRVIGHYDRGHTDSNPRDGD